jgi:hypothetical protein
MAEESGRGLWLGLSWYLLRRSEESHEKYLVNIVGVPA